MQAPNIIPLETLTSGVGKNFFEHSEENPCQNCSAPCCRMLLINHPTPTTYMDLDYIRYMIGFQSVKMILTTDGQWQMMVEQNCRLLDVSVNLCTLHGTPRKPKICVFFNPYQCWYKRNFTTTNPPDIVRIEIDVLDAILAQVRFDEEGNIVELPTYDVIRELANTSESIKKQVAWFPLLEDDLKRRATAMT